MKDIRFQITVKNNILLKLREHLGFTQKKLAYAIGINVDIYSSYEGMRKNPINHRTGVLNKPAQKILDFYEVSFDEIWTPGILSIKTNQVIREYDSQVMLQAFIQPLELANPEEALLHKEMEDGTVRSEIKKVIATLTPREEKILEEYYLNKKPEKQIADDFFMTKQGVNFIRHKAIRKLHHEARLGNLRKIR